MHPVGPQVRVVPPQQPLGAVAQQVCPSGQQGNGKPPAAAQQTTFGGQQGAAEPTGQHFGVAAGSYGCLPTNPEAQNVRRARNAPRNITYKLRAGLPHEGPTELSVAADSGLKEAGDHEVEHDDDDYRP